ncbi:vacuolar protein sorting-associated protein 45 homolog isoform X4 [Brassica napus]|uniref:vacuolar protein sorting-associated protein 45 homolog isoform X4 n=1 Tax=Brassica napus TaxID=3708 RepID=UPI0020798D85|nr:vacuolar protein sorting-associated protein 45 homolog isoform X4 [Brassica napus]
MPLLTYPSLPSLLSGDTETRNKTSSPVSISTLFQDKQKMKNIRRRREERRVVVMEMAAMTVMGTCLQLAFSLRISCVLCSFELRDTFVFQKLMYQHESGLFDFRRTESSPLLLVIDKRDDPAMVHELIGLEDNKVDVRAIGSLSKDQQVELVLSSEQDAFFKANMYENFGDIGMNIKRLVDHFQQVAKSNKNIQTVEDMARFVDSYPEYKKMQGNVSKHVTLVTEMSKLVEARKLMLVSQTEQDLACNGGSWN